MKTYYLPPRIADKYIHYVEKSEKLKFKRKPSLGSAELKGANGTHEWQHRGDKVVHAKIKLGVHVLSTDKKKAYTNKGKVVLLHELRENLYVQHNPKAKAIKSASNPYHKKANKHRTEDIKNVRRKLI